jgi:hypothetical protein
MALAEKVFGPARVADSVARVAGVLVGWGYLLIADDVWAKLLWAGLHLEPAGLCPALAAATAIPSNSSAPSR